MEWNGMEWNRGCVGEKSSEEEKASHAMMQVHVNQLDYLVLGLSLPVGLELGDCEAEGSALGLLKTKIHSQYGTEQICNGWWVRKTTPTWFEGSAQKQLRRRRMSQASGPPTLYLGFHCQRGLPTVVGSKWETEKVEHCCCWNLVMSWAYSTKETEE